MLTLRLPHPGSLVAFAILALVAGGFIALATFDGGTPTLFSIGPYLGRVLAFSIIQATLSTLLSACPRHRLGSCPRPPRHSRAETSFWRP